MGLHIQPLVANAVGLGGLLAQALGAVDKPAVVGDGQGAVGCGRLLAGFGYNELGHCNRGKPHVQTADRHY